MTSEQIKVDISESTETQIEPGIPMRDLTAALQADDGYAWSWFCNIAMAFQDSFAVEERPAGLHRKANEGAARFMRQAFDIDVTQFSQYKSLEAQWNAPVLEETVEPGLDCTVGLAGWAIPILDDVVPGAEFYTNIFDVTPLVVTKVGVEAKTGSDNSPHRWVVINDLAFFSVDPETQEVPSLLKKTT